MIEPGRICRDRTREKFKIAIVLGPSQKDGKLRVCRWQPSTNPQVVEGRWSAPCVLFAHQLEPLSADFDLTTRRGQIVSQAKRSIVNGLVRWSVGRPLLGQPALTEVHDIGTVLP